ncbi:50S ribosomal protein L11 methyltransferase [Paeniglutamicibacter psychrophenolicus]|uniref:16S rRNA G1207 methylase RsmC n=1 Tax=Paeniglutamicibacter psychrophenolicus TaxID=257454 RepID=A0ABS4WCV8_9MICC|nr:class I SAM-dependent methyltransferase [Paeniglutamicibacter psychrophenolicus]MBP2374045.1 16S rRNA G1207 methylase RsmC [Paeniglutamicibacter psychrophenolicus]
MANQSSEAAASQLEILLTPQGWELLNSVDPSAAGTKEAALNLNLSLRKDGHPVELVTAVVQQAQLRSKARVKFGPFADRMVFTPAGLEQATRLKLAGLHAQRFTRAGIKKVADLGCGIGADSLALASAEIEVTAVEMDETTAAAATLNLMPWPTATVVNADATEFDLTGFDGVWLDPARRTTDTSGTSRIFDPEAFSPPLSFVESLADRGLAVGVKMGPGLPHSAVPANCEVQWVSINGDVTEAALWFGPLARPGIRRAALVIGAHGATELTSGVDFDPDAALRGDVPVGAIDSYIYEPDGAVIRAGLIDQLLKDTGGHLLDPHIAYFSTAEAVDTPLAKAYKVLAVRPYHVKNLRAWVKAEKIGVLDIKKRGMDVTPEELRKILLAGTGRDAKNKATLVLTRIGDTRLAIEVEPVAFPV